MAEDSDVGGCSASAHSAAKSKGKGAVAMNQWLASAWSWAGDGWSDWSYPGCGYDNYGYAYWDQAWGGTAEGGWGAFWSEEDANEAAWKEARAAAAAAARGKGKGKTSSTPSPSNPAASNKAATSSSGVAADDPAVAATATATATATAASADDQQSWSPSLSCTDEHTARLHFRKTYGVMKEVMERHPTAFAEEGNFLDLGCAPGGFASSLLDQWPHSRGYGVSMPADRGGFPVLLVHERWQVQYSDLMEIASPDDLKCPSSVRMVLGDAQDLGRRVRSGGGGGGGRGKGGKRGNQKAVVEENTGFGVQAACAVLGIWALTLQEFFLGLSRLCDGGHFIFRFGWRGGALTKSEDEWYLIATQRMFALLFAHFTKVKHFKSEFSHQADTTFYVVAEGFRQDLFVSEGMGEKLRAAIQEILVAKKHADLPDILDFLSGLSTPSVCESIEALLDSVAKLKDIGLATRQHIEGKGRAGPEAAIFLSPVPFNLTMQRLRERLDKFGKIAFMKRHAHPIGVGFDALIQFVQPAHASAALEAITTMKLLGDNIFAVRYSDMVKNQSQGQSSKPVAA